MADPEGYIYCNNDLEVRAKDRTSYKTGGWWSTTLSTGGMCEFGYCNATDIREWFAAAKNYIENKFKEHLERYIKSISVRQGAPNAEQQQIIDEAKGLLDNWNDYATYYRRGGGGPVGASFQTGGYQWEDPNDADAAGPSKWDFIGKYEAMELTREIVDFFDSAACLRDKLNDTRPEGMLEEIPGYGKAPKDLTGGEPAPEKTHPAVIAAYAVGAWVVLKALTE